MLSGFGLECARVAAHEGMNLVRVDVQADALACARAEIEALAAPLGGRVLARTVEVSNAESMQALADEVLAQLGAPHAAGPGPQPYRPLPRAARGGRPVAGGLARRAL